MSTLAETLATLKDGGGRLPGMPELRVYTELPTTAQPPCLYVRSVARTYDRSFAETLATVVLVALVSYADKRTAPAALYDLLEFSQIPTHLQALGFDPEGHDEPALYTFGGANLLGAEIKTTIEIPYA